MIIKNTDLFNGLSQEAVNEISKTVVEEPTMKEPYFTLTRIRPTTFIPS